MTEETYSTHVELAQYLIAPKFMHAVHEKAITKLFCTWTVMLPHIDAIADDHHVSTLAGRMIRDASFVQAKRDVVGPLMTTRLLDAMLNELENRERWGLCETAMSDTPVVMRWSFVLYRLFLRFAGLKYGYATDSWLKQSRIKERISLLAYKFNMRFWSVKTKKFFDRHPSWKSALREAKKNV